MAPRKGVETDKRSPTIRRQLQGCLKVGGSALLPDAKRPRNDGGLFDGKVGMVRVGSVLIVRKSRQNREHLFKIASHGEKRLGPYKER